MDKELSEQLNVLRDAITEAMRNSEPVEKAIHALLRRTGNDVQIEINLVLVNIEPEAEFGSATPVVDGTDDPAGKLTLNRTDSLFLQTLNISDL
jgi:hypothetical protein